MAGLEDKMLKTGEYFSSNINGDVLDTSLIYADNRLMQLITFNDQNFEL